MIHRALDSGLNELKEQLLRMAGFVELAVEQAIGAWRTRSAESIERVYDIERSVNECHIQIDASCLRLLATQGPLAGDLRLILATTKINTDLERMVDQAVNIAMNSGHYLKAPPAHQLEDLSSMADEVRAMVRSAIDAFVRSDEALARQVMQQDDKVDAYKNKIFRDMVDQMKIDRTTIEQGLNLILIARNLERIGDHATNVAEDVIFTISGVDIRHGGKQ